MHNILSKIIIYLFRFYNLFIFYILVLLNRGRGSKNKKGEGGEFISKFAFIPISGVAIMILFIVMAISLMFGLHYKRKLHPCFYRYKNTIHYSDYENIQFSSLMKNQGSLSCTFLSFTAYTVQLVPKNEKT